MSQIEAIWIGSFHPRWLRGLRTALGDAAPEAQACLLFGNLAASDTTEALGHPTDASDPVLASVQ